MGAGEMAELFIDSIISLFVIVLGRMLNVECHYQLISGHNHIRPNRNKLQYLNSLNIYTVRDS